MAVGRFKLQPKSLEDLARRAADAALPRMAKELKRGVTRPGHSVELTLTELETIVLFPLLPDQARAVNEALTAARAAHAYEERRDAQLAHKLSARRAQLYALRAKEDSRAI